jgi:hypothetical protein
MREGKYDPEKHVNYVHIVGRVKSLSIIENTTTSPHVVMHINIETFYQGKSHPSMTTQVVAWDRFVGLIRDYEICVGDTLHIEGRLTIRYKKDKMYSGITANRIGVVRKINGDKYVQTLQEDNDSYGCSE